VVQKYFLTVIAGSTRNLHFCFLRRDCGFPYYDLTGQALAAMTIQGLTLIFRFNYFSLVKPLREQGLILCKETVL
jgi:hypothetical protein